MVGDGCTEGVAAVLEERGLAFVAVESSADFDSDAPPAAVILCPAGSLAGAGEQIASLQAAVPGAAILAVCGEIRPGELRLALGAGVAGVVLESSLAASLEPSLTAVRAGQVCVPRLQARQVEASRLSAREKQILGLVVMGYMNSEIAEQLFVAISTVKSHLSSAFAKLGVGSRSEAVDLILDPDRGLGMGILALGGEPIEIDGVVS